MRQRLAALVFINENYRQFGRQFTSLLAVSCGQKSDKFLQIIQINFYKNDLFLFEKICKISRVATYYLFKN